MRGALRLSILWLVLVGASRAGAGEGVAGGSSTALRFDRHGEAVAELSLAAMRDEVDPVEVIVREPYEGRDVRFAGFDFAELMDAVFGRSWRGEEEILFTCSDGYQPTVPVRRFLSHRALLAFARKDQADFTILKQESGSHKRIDLGPFYLIWDNLSSESLLAEGDYGWPYQLVGIELIRARERFPKSTPGADAAEEVQAGFAAFRVHCSRCHAINGEGGSIGPELNAPRNPVEYRERTWLRAWIDDPSKLLATARMPRLNPALAQRGRVIDELIAYLQAMADARGEGSKEASHVP